jgi:hypothetical protein
MTSLIIGNMSIYTKSGLQSLLTKNRAENLKNRAKYETGLDKLSSSAQQVAVMQTELKALMPKLMVTVQNLDSAQSFSNDRFSILNGLR